MTSLVRTGWAALGLSLAVLTWGCGTPGAPQPPSLDLPETVGDLSATRAGTQVRLSWTMPKRSTDRTMIKGDVPVRVCRRQSDAALCDPAGPDQMTAPGATGTYTDTLPADLATGSPRAINYFVELRNKKGRSAGLSNPAVVLAGAAPGPLEGLTAEVRKEGVVLNWAAGGDKTAIRLERKLLKAAPKTEQGPLAPAPEPETQNLLVEQGDAKGQAIDKTVRFGESYEYRAQRVARVDVNGKVLELDGAFSPAVQVDVTDVFPPAVPTGLVAVASAGVNGAAPAIDLSWQPDAEPDVSGYVVYRRDEGGDWQRLSTGTMLEPAFHDASVQAGHTYRYAVSALDRGGHESARTAEAQETVPQQ